VKTGKLREKEKTRRVRSVPVQPRAYRRSENERVSHPAGSNMQPPQTKCVECGKPSLTGIYCSKSCRKRANRQEPLPSPARVKT